MVVSSSGLESYQVVADHVVREVGVPVQVHAFEDRRRSVESVVEKLRKAPPELVVALGAKAAYAVHEGLPDVPVVHAMVVDPARYGLSGPGFVGVEHRVSVEDQFAHLRLFAPDVHSVGMLLWEGNHSEAARDAQRVAKDADYALKVLRVQDGRDVRGAFQRLRRDIDALWLIPDRKVITPENFRYLRDETRRLGIPLLVYSENLVRAGALMCVAPSLEAVGAQLAEISKEIMAGAEVSTMADRVPGRVRVVLNRDTLDAIGLEIDPLMLDFVDEVFSEVAGR